MDKNIVVTEILNFFNLADVELISAMPDATGKPLGTAVAKRVVEERAKVSKQGFSNLEQLMKVKGLGESNVTAILKRMLNSYPHPDKVRSRTIFTFAKQAPELKEYEGDVVLEKLPSNAVDEKGNPVEIPGQASYALYYRSGVNKDQLFKRLEADTNFLTSEQDRKFAIQTRNNQFVATSVPNSSVYLREMFFANKFRIRTMTSYAHGILFAANRPNAKRTVSIETDFYGNLGVLSFNPTANRVGTRHVTPNQTLPLTDFFDISGIISEPWNGAHPLFKNFTLMTHVQANIPSGDPREFIAADNAVSQPGSQNGLVGNNNNNESWRRECQLRYVEVVENVAIESVFNTTQNSNSRWFLYASNNQGDVNVLGQAPTAGIPLAAQWDMYVFYGYWDERSNIATRVAFRSKASGHFLGLKANSLGIYENLNTINSSLNEMTSFYVENGWGGTGNNVQIKTSSGKYLRSWQTTVIADSVSPINDEQFKIIIP